MTVALEYRDYGIFGKCLHLSNARAELYVTTGFGPRVIHYSLLGEENFFYTNEGLNHLQKGPAFDEAFYPGAYWNVYGGNRLWRCPHHYPTVFYPDHEPVEVEETATGAVLHCLPQIHNQVRNHVEVSLDPESSRVVMNYRIENVGQERKKIGCWALNVCKNGGVSVFPQPQTPLGVVPNRHITLWDYSDMRDGRVHWGGKYISLRGDSAADKPIKIGINNEDGWAIYLNMGRCYILRFEPVAGAEYADFGVSYETYANPYFLELETLSPLRDLAPGESVEHREEWELLPCDCMLDPADEEQADRLVERLGLGRR